MRGGAPAAHERHVNKSGENPVSGREVESDNLCL